MSALFSWVGDGFLLSTEHVSSPDLYYSIVAAGHCVIACNMHSCGCGYSSTCTSLAAGLLGLQVAVAFTIQ